jgi:hypothetical protein
MVGIESAFFEVRGMPGGPLPLGLVYFAGVKLAGYTISGHCFNRLMHATRPRPWVFGAARTALGLAAGIAFGTAASNVGLTRSELVYYLALAPVRMGEWLLILWLFYGKRGLHGGRLSKYAAGGSAWSYLLDVPAILAVFVIPGGAWVC